MDIKKNISGSTSVIQDEAVSLYDYWKKCLGESDANSPEFIARKFWFHKSRIRLSCTTGDRLENLLMPIKTLH
jgi:hypothetical protein